MYNSESFIRVHLCSSVVKKSLYRAHIYNMIRISVLIYVLAGSQLLFAQVGGVGESLRARTDFVKLEELEKVKIDLKYASTDNFLKENLYGEFKSCYLHKDAFAKFQKAIATLRKTKPQFQFILYDCLRPRSIQYKLWEKVKGTKEEAYVANPEKGSIHNFGFALDLSLLDENGKEVDMGTPFDAFSPLSEPNKEEYFLKIKKISNSQFENRQILRNAMTKSGFIQRPNEWWHYDALTFPQVRKNYKMIE